MKTLMTPYCCGYQIFESKMYIYILTSNYIKLRYKGMTKSGGKHCRK